MSDPQVFGALASMFAAIFNACGAFILMMCVRRMGRICDELRLRVRQIESFGPFGNDQPRDFHSTFASQSLGAVRHDETAVRNAAESG